MHLYEFVCRLCVEHGIAQSMSSIVAERQRVVFVGFCVPPIFAILV